MATKKTNFIHMKTSNIIFLSAVILIFISLTSLSLRARYNIKHVDETTVTNHHDYANFNRINSNGNISLKISKAKTFSIKSEVSGQESLETLTFSQTKNQLDIQYSNDKKIHLEIELPSLEFLQLKNQSKASIIAFEGDKMELVADGRYLSLRENKITNMTIAATDNARITCNKNVFNQLNLDLSNSSKLTFKNGDISTINGDIKDTAHVFISCSGAKININIEEKASFRKK